MKAQVKSSHYIFDRYMNKRRWMSYYYQIEEVISINPESILEIGPGDHTFTHIMRHRNFNVTTLDLAEDVNPDIVSSVLDIPCPPSSFDAVCAFQVLEHLPFEDFPRALDELSRVAKRFVFLSLPHCGRYLSVRVSLSNRIKMNFGISIPSIVRKEQIFDGEHYWEIGKKGSDISKVENIINERLKIYKSLRNPENTYHQFYFCENSDIG